MAADVGTNGAGDPTAGPRRTGRSPGTGGTGGTDSNGYAAWVRWLEAFRRGEDPPTDGLGPVEGRLGSYVEARVLDRLSVAFAERVRQWQTALGDRIVARPPDGAADAARVLREAVDRLAPLTRLASSPLLPRAVGATMHAVLGEVRDGARSALDEAWRRHVEEAEEVGAPFVEGAFVEGSRTDALVPEARVPESHVAGVPVTGVQVTDADVADVRVSGLGVAGALAVPDVKPTA